MVEADLIDCRYRSAGPNLLNDIFRVHFKVDGENHHHDFPNHGWGFQNPTLMLLGYFEIRPGDFDGDSIEFEPSEKIEVVEQDGEYFIPNLVLQEGVQKLKDCEWFEPEGDVWNSQEASLNNQAGGPDPGTGNFATSPQEEKGNA